MQTSVIGYPRIGTLRELKYASEKYFKNEISEEKLINTGTLLRRTHWNTQKAAGIDFISSNDFSYYLILHLPSSVLSIVKMTG